MIQRSQGVTRVVTITSGKGGVGKTTTAVNLGLSLVAQGRSVLLLDADLGLANIDVMLGIHPQYTLLDLFEGDRTLPEIITTTPHGLAIIPAARGVERLATLTVEERILLMTAVEEVAAHYDYLLIDTQAGIGPDVLSLASASAEVICVINGEPTTLTDAYALIKVLSQSYGEKQVSVLVNEVKDSREAQSVFVRLATSVERFLHVELTYSGFIPSDEAVQEAVLQQQPLVEVFPSSRAARAYGELAKKVDALFHAHRIKGGMQFFFQQLLEGEAYGS
jgi:flagellar biosynthesis protein FlhG